MIIQDQHMRTLYDINLKKDLGKKGLNCNYML